MHVCQVQLARMIEHARRENAALHGREYKQPEDATEAYGQFRRQIVALLKDGPMTQREICEALGAGQSSVSYRLLKMRDEGLLSVSTKDRRNVYALMGVAG